MLVRQRFKRSKKVSLAILSHFISQIDKSLILIEQNLYYNHGTLRDMADKPKRTLEEGQALIALVLAGLLGLGIFFYTSSKTWKSSETIIDYQIALKMTQNVWSQTSLFVSDTSKWGGISLTSKILSVFSDDAAYSTQVINKFNKSELKSTIKAMAENAKILIKYNKAINQYKKILKQPSLSISNRSRLNAKLKKMEANELKYRQQHNLLYNFNMDMLASLQKKAALVYLLFLLPYILAVILGARFLFARMLLSRKSGLGETSIDKAVLYTPKAVVNEQLSKAIFGTATKPEMEKKWKSSEFGKDVVSLWNKSGFTMPLLAMNIAAFLYKNKDVPASICGHSCYTGGLLDHTLNVMKEALAYNKTNQWSNFRGELLLLSAMGHDIGKCSTYFFDEKTNAWYDNGGYHDKEAGWILQSLPGFTILDTDGRMALLMAVKNRHDRDSIPINYPAFSVLLFKALSVIDDKASANEINSVSEFTDKAAVLVPSLWGAILASLNVNGYMDGVVDGYYDSRQNLLVIPEPQLTARIIKSLPFELRDRLPLKATKNALHPMWKSVLNILLERHLILSEAVFIAGDQETIINTNDYGFIPLFAYADLIKNGVVLNYQMVDEALLQKWDIIELNKLKMKPATNLSKKD